MSAQLNEQVLGYIETTGQALGIALKMAEANEAQKAESAEKVAKLADLLKQAGLVDDHETEKAAGQLANPSQALDILQNVLTHYHGELKQAQAKVASVTMGGGVSDEAGDPAVARYEKQSNYTGHRRGNDELAPSDMAILSLLERR